ncbi:hypothetical protein FAM09_11450 [Niastella caeni]|uniref:EF-hand domain-containing protein n=1 Tax=Niastella caeni TaxID=2569763 RepID=A0A4S8I019_9BACT|nr:hypothetical protein [Niastella caeni]THU40469.1 hypothetical protein FAM09_11450 [Niastella caeni]
MKRNLLGILSLVLAITISSFTTKKTVTVYLDYNGSGNHDVLGNYTYPASVQNPISGDSFLAWIKIVDDNGTITTDEFAAAYDVLDRSTTPNSSLNDASDTEGTFGNYQLERED